MNRYFGDKFTKYIQSNDENVIKNIDSKMLAQYHKINESMDRIVAEITGKSNDENTPLLNINMTGNATIKQVDDKTIEIDSDSEIKEEQVKDILNNLSKLKKMREDS